MSIFHAVACMDKDSARVGDLAEQLSSFFLNTFLK